MTDTPSALPDLPTDPAGDVGGDTITDTGPRRARGRRRRTRQDRARRRAIWIAAVVVLLFVAALVFWARQPDGDPLPKGLDAPTASDPGFPADLDGTGGTPSPSPSATGSAAAGASQVANLPDLPTGSDINVSGLPKRSVVINVTSDGTVAAFGYIVAHGKPERYQASFLKSPVQVTTVGRSNGAVVVVGAQAAADATYVTCKVSVDGKVVSTRTTHGAYTVTVCIG